jgi:hypothetical protein
MAVAGWSKRDIIDRYTGASASERAAAEARTLNLGELGDLRYPLPRDPRARQNRAICFLRYETWSIS